MERITSRQNPLLQQVKKLQTNRKFRQEQGVFVGDGVKLLAEAAKWYTVSTVIFTPGVTLPELPATTRLVEVPESLMEHLSQMKSPQGAIFLCPLPEQKEEDLVPGTLALEGIQDPGNLGTILRTADAFSVPVVLLDGCTDPYQPKVVRSTMGASFRAVPQQMTTQRFLELAGDIPVIATALRPDAVDIATCDLKAGITVIGSEGQGLSDLLLEKATQSVIIPMAPQCESLNAAVASTVVMWELRKG